ncbi:MAG: IS4 family transposase [Candidatus Uhrbacteria bacterium]
MKSVEELAKTTFSGRRFTRKQLEQVQETVNLFQNLSRKELASTICEHLKWTSPNGSNKIHSCLSLLEELEKQEVIVLPEKRQSQKPVRHSPLLEGCLNNPQPIEAPYDAISPIELQLVISEKDRAEWNAYINTYHYLGYSHPFGSHLCYFIVSKPLGQKLGCLLFSASAAWALAPRDTWIGWEKKHRQKLLHLIISNSRFLIFPWVKVPHLASKSLSMATKQIGDDWTRVYGYRPVLIETFIDTTKYTGTCYRAANWQHIGQTKGRGRFDPHHEHKETIKDIFVYPLQDNWQHALTHGQQKAALKKKYRNDLKSIKKDGVDDTFVMLWEKVIHIISEVAAEYDEKWQIRNRVINSLMLILLTFRLVCSKNSQSYGATIDELWNNCDTLGLPLAQKTSIAPSSFCDARKKLDEQVFQSINTQIIAAYEQHIDDDSYRWLGHRLFAVDGSKINLPRSLTKDGYKLPKEQAYYPQGLVSCLYQVKTQIPIDFDLTKHCDERLCAIKHLDALQKNDVVIYDRGYLSYVMLHQHYATGIHAIFRLQENTFKVVNDFFSSSSTDIIATVNLDRKTKREILKRYPNLNIVPLNIRLIKYEIADNMYCLGTTLLDQDHYNSIQAFKDVYHERWGIEELYKVSKRIFIVEDFHAKSERGVKQELFGHFVLITMNRMFANQANTNLNTTNNANYPSQNDLNIPNHNSEKIQIRKIKVNFKNCIHVFTKYMEELVIIKSKIKKAVLKTFSYIIKQFQKDRPGRSYERKSMRPETKWRPPKKKKQKQITVVAEANV